jgi:hypothetical protein
MAADSDTLGKLDISFRVDWGIISPSADMAERVQKAVARHNDKLRLHGLSDDLDPYIIDAAKVDAFLSGLPALPKDVLAKLQGGKPLLLADLRLALGTACPVTAKTLRQGFTLEVKGSDSPVVEAIVHAPIDVSLAKALCLKAQTAVTQFSQEVQGLRTKQIPLKDKPNELSQLLRRELSTAERKRYAAASVWRINAEELLKLQPKDPARIKDVQEARSAEAKYLTPPRTGMPG